MISKLSAKESTILIFWRERVEAGLRGLLSGGGQLQEAMKYAVLNGGKRMRATLVYESAKLCGVTMERADPVAEAIELIHAYSLVHDDLPAMDDDDLRRGKPTVHVKWDEATAILVGDALQSLAFERIASSELESEAKVALLRELAWRARGMVEGQMFDLLSEDRLISYDELRELHRRKTGDLIAFSTISGALISGKDVKFFEEYGYHLGAAFQIQDDILDVEANSEVLGKTAGKDENAHKSTAVSLLGLEGARTAARKHVEQAIDALSRIDGDREGLRFIAEWAITRGH